MKQYKLVCFDMDGTLITNTNSVKYLCVLNDRAKEVKLIEEKEEKDEISWIEADYIKAELFAGLQVKRVEEDFGRHIKLIKNIDKVLEELRDNNIKSILVTAGPIQVAEVLGRKFKFDKVFGSIYDVKHGIFTGKILNHLGDSGKLNSLISFCKSNNFELEEVVSIGDSASDIMVFEKSGRSIAINYTKRLLGKADIYVKTENLDDILKDII